MPKKRIVRLRSDMIRYFLTKVLTALCLSCSFIHVITIMMIWYDMMISFIFIELYIITMLLSFLPFLPSARCAPPWSAPQSSRGPATIGASSHDFFVSCPFTMPHDRHEKSSSARCSCLGPGWRITFAYRTLSDVTGRQLVIRDQFEVTNEFQSASPAWAHPNRQGPSCK